MSDKPGGHSKKKLLSTLGGLLLLALFLRFLLVADWDKVLQAMERVPLPLLLLLLSLQVLTQVLLGFQWLGISRLVLSKGKENSLVRCGFGEIFYILSTGSVIEALTPGAKIGGEVTRLYYLKKELSASTEEATHCILLQKSISMTVLFGICLGSLLYMTDKLRQFLPPTEKNLLLLCCFLLLGFFLLVLFSSEQMGRYCSSKSGKFLPLLGKYLLSYHQSLSLFSKRQWCWQFAISLLVWTLFPLKMLLLVGGMGYHIHPMMLFTITMTAYMVGMLPLSPGGLGTFEASVVGMFSFLPLGMEEALTIAVIFRFVTFWFVMLGSTVYVLWYRRKRGHHGKKL